MKIWKIVLLLGLFVSCIRTTWALPETVNAPDPSLTIVCGVPGEFDLRNVPVIPIGGEQATPLVTTLHNLLEQDVAQTTPPLMITPEPSSLLLVGSGLLGVIMLLRRKKMIPGGRKMIQKHRALLVLVCVFSFLASLGGIATSAYSAPRIELTSIPPIGSSANLQGRVVGVNPADYTVAVYIYVGGWWTKPYFAAPLTTIQQTGTWTCDITTGGSDEQATQIVAYLLPKGINPPALGGSSSLPASLDTTSVAKVFVNRPGQNQPFVYAIDYSPFRDGDSPLLGIFPTEQEIRQDLTILSGITPRIRTYGVDDILAEIPRLAQTFSLDCYVGAWLSSDENANQQQIARLIQIAQEGYNTTKGLIIGSEVLLRGDLSEDQLLQYIAQVKQATNLPVTTADTYSEYLSHPNIAQAVDFILMHVHPYWEGIAIDSAPQHVIDQWNAVRQAYPQKDVLVGETGWPTAGATQGAAVPSEANQTQFLSQFRALALLNNIKYFYFEAFDEAWKIPEGEVGGHWGIYYSNRSSKPVINIPKLPEIYVQQDVTNIPNGGSHAIGATPLGSSSSTTFSIKNIGMATLSLTGNPKVQIAGEHAGDFIVTQQPVSPVAPNGGLTTFILQFTPSASGIRTTQVSITSNDSSDTLYTFTVDGTGSAAVVISGNIHTAGGTGIADVVLQGLPGNPVTDANGAYQATVPYGWSGTVTPQKTGAIVTPTTRTYTNVVADKITQNYVVTLQDATHVNLAKNLSCAGFPDPHGSDPGWGGGSNVCEIVDGQQSCASWDCGLAFCGGIAGWCGEPGGIRQATINFGRPVAFDTVVIWWHGTMHMPQNSSLSYWDETTNTWQAINFTRTYPIPPSSMYWSIPDHYAFSQITSSKVRVAFDNTLLATDGTQMDHGWIYEFEVFGPPLVTISGSVKTSNGIGIADVVLQGLPGNPVTDASGAYQATVPYGWSGLVTPQKAGYAFTPGTRSYTNVTTNQTAQDYTATLDTYTISGSVTVNGVGLAGVTLSGLPGNPMTTAAGAYTATVTYGWSGTVTPQKTGYTFDPANRTYTNVTANQANQNYTGIESSGDFFLLWTK